MVVRRRRMLQLGACSSSGLGDPLFFWSPGDIAVLKGEVDTQIQNLMNDARAAHTTGSLSDTAYTDVLTFQQEWNQYADSIGTWDTLWGSVAMQMKQYQRRATDWSTKLASLGVTTITPPPPKTPSEALSDFVGKASGGLLDSVGTAGKWIIGGAVILGGIYLAGQLASVYKTTRRVV